MASLFYLTGAPAEKQIVKYSNFKDHFPNVNQSMQWSQLEPYIRQAEKKFLFPYLSQEFYDELVASELGTPSATQLELIELIRDSLAYYTVHHAMPHINMIISDMGLRENSSSDGTSAPVAMWRYKNTRWESINHADDTLDQLLEKLETLAAEDDADVDTWKSSDAFTENASCLFRRTSEMRQHIPMRQSRRTFIALIPFVKKAEEQFVRTMLCDTQYDRICEGVLANNLTAEETNLLTKCQPVAAFNGLIMAIPYLRILVEDDGLKMVSSTDGMSSKKDVVETAIAQLLARAKADANRSQAELREFLYANADDYPDWKASDCYIDPDLIDNQPTLPEYHQGGIWL